MQKETLSKYHEKPNPPTAAEGHQRQGRADRMNDEYAAGLIDGEGYLGIRIQRSRVGWYYKPCVKVAMTRPEAVRALYLRFGGNVDLRRRMVKSNHRLSFCWSVSTFVSVARVLEAIWPYLLVKSQQAAILREFLALKSPGLNRYDPRQQEILSKRHALYLAIRELNHRGRPAAETERERSLAFARDEATVRTMRQERMETGRNDLSALPTALSQN